MSRVILGFCDIAKLSQVWWNSLTCQQTFICKKCSTSFTSASNFQKHKPFCFFRFNPTIISKQRNFSSYVNGLKKLSKARNGNRNGSLVCTSSQSNGCSSSNGSIKVTTWNSQESSRHKLGKRKLEPITGSKSWKDKVRKRDNKSTMENDVENTGYCTLRGKLETSNLHNNTSNKKLPEDSEQLLENFIFLQPIEEVDVDILNDENTIIVEMLNENVEEQQLDTSLDVAAEEVVKTDCFPLDNGAQDPTPKIINDRETMLEPCQTSANNDICCSKPPKKRFSASNPTLKPTVQNMMNSVFEKTLMIRLTRCDEHVVPKSVHRGDPENHVTVEATTTDSSTSSTTCKPQAQTRRFKSGRRKKLTRRSSRNQPQDFVKEEYEVVDYSLDENENVASPIKLKIKRRKTQVEETTSKNNKKPSYLQQLVDQGLSLSSPESSDLADNCTTSQSPGRCDLLVANEDIGEMSPGQIMEASVDAPYFNPNSYCSVCGSFCDHQYRKHFYKEQNGLLKCITCTKSIMESEWSLHDTSCKNFDIDAEYLEANPYTPLKRRSRDFICQSCFSVLSKSN